MPKDKSSGKKLADMMYGSDQMRATPQSRITGPVANALRKAQQFASQYELDPRIPLLGGTGVDELLSLPEAASLMEDVSYNGPGALIRGGNVATGGIGTFRPDPRITSAVDVAGTATGLGQLGAMAARSAPGALKAAARNISAPRTLSPQAGAIIIPSKISNVKEAIRQSKGEYGAKRVERAADEIKNLERLYKESALREAFGGDNARALMTMNPADFEKYAVPLQPRFTDKNSTRYTTSGERMDYPEYMSEYLPNVGAFNDVPFLLINKEEQGLPLVPFITGHEGRHRNRVMAGKGEEAGLVQLLPRAELREPFPRRHQEEYIEALKEELGMTGNMVLPERFIDEGSDATIRRPAIKLPEVYAEGGSVRFSDNPDVMQLELAGGGLVKGAAKGLKRLTADAPAPAYNEVGSMVAKMGEEGRSPIIPVPNRWFLQPDKFPGQQKLVERVLQKTGKSREEFTSGAFIDPRTGEVLDSRIMDELGVVIDPKTNRPMMSAKGQSGIEQLDPKTGAYTKSNLVRKGLFKPEGGDPLLNDLNFLATIEKGDVGHKYGLATEYASPTELWNTGTGANPTLRPRSRGDLFGVGDVVGRVRVGRSEPHDVYEKLFVAPKGSDVQGVKLSKAAGGAVRMAGGGALAKLAKLARAPAKSKQEIEAIAERIAPQVTGEYVRESAKSAKTVAGKTQKQFQREKTLPVDVRPTTEERIPQAVDIEKLKGDVMIGVPGDPTLTGKTLYGVGDFTLGSPSPQHGGPLYGLYSDDAFWASGIGPARGVQNLAKRASKQYDAPVKGNYIMMGPESINYAQHFADANLQAIDLSRMTKSQVEKFNELIRKGSPKSGPRDSFPGIEDKGEAYLQMAMDPELRKHFNALMQMPTVTEPLNLPSGTDIRFAITEPALRDLETGVTGFSMGRMRPDVASKDLPLSTHPTYDYDIPGEFMGQSRYPVPYELSFPDTLQSVRANPKQARQEFGSLKMVGPRQIIDQQMIDEIKMYEERMKQLTGKKAGGAVRKAAGGEITADDLILEERKL